MLTSNPMSETMNVDLNNTISLKNRLKEYLLISDEREENQNSPPTSSHVIDIRDNSDQDNTKIFLSHTQVKRTLPCEADSSWSPAKLAQISAICCSHHTDFLQGALKNGCIEEWAIQAKELPLFMMKIPNFKHEYYQLRLKHAKETMTLAIKHLQDSAKADKRTATTLKGAADCSQKDVAKNETVNQILPNGQSKSLNSSLVSNRHTVDSNFDSDYVKKAMNKKVKKNSSGK